MISILDQLVAYHSSKPEPKDLIERIVHGFKPKSYTEDIYLQMADGRVWHSVSMAEAIGIKVSSARSSLRRLEAKGLVVCVGEEIAKGTPYLRRKFRRADFIHENQGQK